VTGISKVFAFEVENWAFTCSFQLPLSRGKPLLLGKKARSVHTHSGIILIIDFTDIEIDQ